ncbi:MAG: nucleoside triphosphate pyrophosphohydrolase family protein [Coleofasciculaceae cyanobacterium]
MKFKEYQDLSRQIAIRPGVDAPLTFQVLGLCGESGEVADKLKKIMRDKGGIIEEKDKAEIAEELGDVLWHLAQVASELNWSLDDIAQASLEKVRARLKKVNS